MHLDAVLGVLVAVVFAIVLVAIALRAVGQPQIAGYLLAGVAIGPSGLEVLSDADTISRIGSFGLIILLFFIGMGSVAETPHGAMANRRGGRGIADRCERRRRVADRLGVRVVVAAAAIVGLSTAVNAGILKVLGSSVRRSLYGGALLSQIGEFSFVLVSVGVGAGVIAQRDYRIMIAVIAISLLLSPPWITLWRYALGHPEGHPDRPPMPRSRR